MNGVANTDADDGYQDWWKEKLKIMNQIDKTCRKYGSAINSSDSILRGQLYNKKKHILNCRNAKVKLSISSLSSFLNRLLPAVAMPGFSSYEKSPHITWLVDILTSPSSVLLFAQLICVQVGTGSIRSVFSSLKGSRSVRNFDFR